MSLLVRLPVAASITQLYGVNPTLGVVGNWNGTPIERLVAQYGNYQDYGHDGLDQGAEPGTTVYPMAAGHVDYAGLGQNMPEDVANKWAFIFGPGGWPSGNIVCIDHRNGLGTYYAHNRAVLVRSGAEVNEYTPIALSGGVPDEQPGSGRSGGAHVHTSAVLFDRVYVTPNYGRVDPLMYLPAGWSIPTSPGGTGDPATGARATLVGIPGIYIK